jgi:hypothetical protein
MQVAAAAAAILNSAESGTAERSLVEAAALNYRKSKGDHPAAVCNASVIERGLLSFFTQLSLNLQVGSIV